MREITMTARERSSTPALIRSIRSIYSCLFNRRSASCRPRAIARDSIARAKNAARSGNRDFALPVMTRTVFIIEALSSAGIDLAERFPASGEIGLPQRIIEEIKDRVDRYVIGTFPPETIKFAQEIEDLCVLAEVLAGLGGRPFLIVGGKLRRRGHMARGRSRGRCTLPDGDSLPGRLYEDLSGPRGHPAGLIRYGLGDHSLLGGRDRNPDVRTQFQVIVFRRSCHVIIVDKVFL